MTKQQFHAHRLNAIDCSDFEQYTTKCGGSMQEEHFADDSDIVSIMRQIWDLAHDFTFRRLHTIRGGSLAAFSREYDIPLRTLEDWNADRRTPPDYVLELLSADVLTTRIPIEK